MGYQRRVVDDELDALVTGGIAAIALEGAKAVGKSFTGSQRVREIFNLENPAVRQILEAAPNRILTDKSVLVDEWQLVPATWGVVRNAVNAGASPGQFFLTGSASGPRHGSHSGAGRIISVRMRPMTLGERGVGVPTVSLSELLTGKKSEISGASSVGLEDYVDEIVRSGFPDIRRLGERARRAQLVGYVDRVIEHDFADVTGRNIRNPPALRRWLTAYAAATATTTSWETIRDAASAGESNKPARSTTTPFRDALEALYVLDPVVAWLPTKNYFTELASAPKHHLVDPALAVTLLGLTPKTLLAGDEGATPIVRDGQLLGRLFESLVALNVRVYASSAEARVGHLRTHRGRHEIDFIVQRGDGRVVALEVKLSGTVEHEDVEHLLWLREEIGEDLLDAAVITTGPGAYRRSDGIAVIPAALLGP